MRTASIPGFTANMSLEKSHYTYRTGTSSGRASSMGVTPQLISMVEYISHAGYYPCCIDGVCGYTCHVDGPGADAPGGWGVGFGGNQDQRNCARCRAGCYRKPAGAARQSCLDGCNDLFC